MDEQRECPECGWPEAETYEIVSRHWTTEGVIAYSRCPCGRLQVRRAGRIQLAGGGSPIGSDEAAASSAVRRGRCAQLPRPARHRGPTTAVWTAVGVTVSLLALAAIVGLPAGAPLALLALGVVIGQVAEAEAERC